MRHLTCLLVALMFATNGLANTGETKTFIFNGTKSDEDLVLDGSKTHTEYRQESRTSTCYRQVIDRYEQRCVQVPYTVCDREQVGLVGDPESITDSEAADGIRPGPGGRPPEPRRPDPRPAPPPVRPPEPPRRPPEPPVRPEPPRPAPRPVPPPPRPPVCRTEYRSECSQVPIYRQEPYSCTQIVSIPYEVTDEIVTANVDFQINAADQALQDTFSVSLSGDNLAVSVSGSSILYSATLQQQSTLSGQNEVVSAKYAVDAEDAVAVNQSVLQNVSDLTMVGNQISFTVGAVVDPKLFVPWLQIDKKSFFADPTLIKRDLNPGEFALMPDGNRTKVVISLDQLGLSQKMDSGTYKVTTAVRLQADAAVLNPAVLSSEKPSAYGEFSRN